MLKLRVNKILENLDAINANYPGLIRSYILGTDSYYSILSVLENQTKEKIRTLLQTLATITTLCPNEVTKKVLRRYEQGELISTTAYGKVTGLDAKEYLFPHLLEIGLITKPLKSYQLTRDGFRFGNYLTSEDGNRFIGWHKEKLDSVVSPIKEHLMGNMKFRLFHITHLSNICSILEHGLYCHNKVPNYKDISNKQVNERRNKEEKFHNHNLHDHVPLYFNPKNAMLYQVMKELDEQVVILEINKEVVLKDYTIFSKGNAARGDSELTPSKFKLMNFPWEDINSDGWNKNGISNSTIKSLTMSECLIFKHIDNKFIEAIHCKNRLIYDSVFEKINSGAISVKVTPELFF
ncbi:TPA: DUF4433 domain-containing protein [Vibrio parahaemolyticus]|nr:DUF4433 domain-containing protein [Vibrio parahaemolyticus]